MASCRGRGRRARAGSGRDAGGHPGAWLLDQRAYPGSRLGSSLDELLTEFGLRLPDCPTEELRYWSGDNIEDTLYLTFAADESCVVAFVAGNGLTPGGPLPGDKLALGKDRRVQEWRWQVAEAGLYATYRGEPKREVEVDLVVDPTGGARTRTPSRPAR